MCLESLAEILLLCYSLFLLIGTASRIYGKLFFNKPLANVHENNGVFLSFLHHMI